MGLFVRFIGLLEIVLGLLAFVNPDLFKAMISYFREEKKIYIAVGLKILIGLIFVLGASSCRLEGVIRIFGLFPLVGSLIGLWLGFQKIQALCDWWLDRPTKMIYVWACVAIGLGILLLYAA